MPQRLTRRVAGCYCLSMETCACEAIVLGMSDYRESDKLVTLFTREHGTVRGVARGAKRSVRRFGGALELFARLKVLLALRQGLSTVQEAEPLTVYPGIRADLAAIGHGGYACELVSRFAPEGMANPRLYRLLVAYLERLDGCGAAPSDRRFFEINLLNILGYRPAFDHCALCGEESAPGSADRCAGPDGSLLCGACGRGGGTVSASVVARLDQALRTGRFGALTLSGAELREAGTLLDAALAAHLDRPLKSLAFLREISP